MSGFVAPSFRPKDPTHDGRTGERINRKRREQRRACKNLGISGKRCRELVAKLKREVKEYAA